MFSYIPNTKQDIESMLETIGVKSVDELFNDIPKELKLNRDLNLNAPMSELEITKHIDSVAGKNISLKELTCFLGAGAYDHYIPSIVKHLTSRSEFYTAYTPYQPEISQGTLQGIFEYQTMICDLTSMDVSNASMYDGSSSTAEACMMAVNSTKRKKVIVSKTLHPETRKIINTYMHFYNVDVIEAPYINGVTDLDELTNMIDKDTAGVVVQSPNFFGIIEGIKEVADIAHGNKSLLITSVDPISLGILTPPGELGADIVTGEGQSLGNPLSFGGPYLGFMATTKKLMRKMPGRIAGQTIDVDGKRAFVLTLQAREQHIRREKSTSNICSNQALNALAASIYLTTLGKKGIIEVASQCAKKAHYTFKKLTKSGKYKPLFDKPFFKEFALKSTHSVTNINKHLLSNGVLGGYDISRDYKELENSMLLCVTEKRSIDEIENLHKLMEVAK